MDEKEHNISTIQDESSKVERIQRAKDLDALRHEAMTEGGLINDELRRIACEFKNIDIQKNTS